MFPVVVFLISAIYSMRKWANTISAYILLCIWVYGDIRLGPLSIISSYILLVLFLYLLKRPTNGGRFVLSRLVFMFSLYMLGLYVLFSFLGSDMSVFVGLSSIKSDFLILAILNLFWNLDISQKEIKTISYTICLSIIVLGVYCIFSYITSTNYYMDYVSIYMTDEEGTKALLEKSMNDERGILHGRISGTSYNCLPFSILLSILFFYTLSFKKHVNRYILLFTLVLIIISLYMTGSRGSMVAVVISFSFYLLRTMSIWKQIIIILLLLVISESSVVSEFLSLLVTDEVGGSSSEQRMGQFVGAIELVSSNLQSFLFGRGIGYTKDYLYNFGPHPLCLGFESTLVHDLVEYGVLGVVFIFIGKLAFCLYIAYTSYKRKLIKRDNYYLLLACLLCNLIYNILIGNGYYTIFIISYFMMIKFFIITDKNVCLIHNR